MAASDAIWAVDLGNNSLKALHLVAVGDAVQVIGFDNIPHGKVLSSSGISAAERDELIAISLRQFVQRNDVSYDPLIVSVPSQNSFARFVTLPPVEAKRLPEIIKFEAAQQIPFDMNEVQWDYTMMSGPEDSEQKVGIFAIKNEVVESAVEHFEREDLVVSYVQMAPMALYNYLLYDRPELVRSDSKATVVINVGADSTDLVVCTQSGVWQRCIMMGGNAFTQAIAETFKLNFEKAEKLKRTAPVSKYARQIFQAMRPVFTDWTGEVQRSLGFYTNSNPDVKLARIVALGGGTKLRGLLKYLSQSLQIPVEKPDGFKRVAVAPGLSTAKFHEGVADFGVVYGLGLQGLGLARIESNLLPTSVARSMAWASKTKYFIGAAVMLFAVSAMCLGRVGLDHISYARNQSTLMANRQVANRARAIIDSASDIESQKTLLQERAQKQFEQFKYREVIPEIYDLVVSALPNAQNNPSQRELYEAYAAANVAAVKQIPRPERKQIFLTHVSIYFAEDIEGAEFGESAFTRKQAAMQAAQSAMGTDDGRGGGPYGGPSAFDTRAYDTYRGGAQPTEVVQKDSGFVVTMVGYSPYKDVLALLHPPNVETKPSEWGVITRLLHLQGPGDANSPYELYSAQPGKHFRLRKYVVDMGPEVPLGVGDVAPAPEEERRAAAAATALVAGLAAPTQVQNVLVDPITREVITAEPRLDGANKPMIDQLGNPVVNERDHWFDLSFKLKWNNAPEMPAAPVPATMMRAY
ncbi:MAG: type IV pilus assembly protein PilM [Sedimentisphaerales bacterium]|nr:type IV pilus assembly protein PilM [Sedimentisphaerales bacterium]